MIKTKSIYKPKEYGDGIRILITRYYPRGVKKSHFDKWFKELAPSKELLYKYKNNNISWKQFTKLFKKELQNENSIDTIQSLRNYKRNVTLLCYEPDGENCHRYIIKDIIDQRS